jgi:putative transposase
MAFVKIWIHAVWSTKNRESILEKSKRIELFKHIRQNAKEKEIYIDFINGVEDHIHALLCLNADLSIAKTMQLIKGESSFWANKENIFSKKLQWADEYFAVSVSESQIVAVREYIRNQEGHHAKKTFSQEYDEFISKFGFQISQG